MVDSTTAFGSGSLTDRRLLGDSVLQLVQRRARMGQRDNRFDHGIPFRSLPFRTLELARPHRRCVGRAWRQQGRIDRAPPLGSDRAARGRFRRACWTPICSLPQRWPSCNDRSAIPPPVSPPRSAKDRRRRAHRMERQSPSECFGTADRRWQCDTGSAMSSRQRDPLEQLGDGTTTCRASISGDG